MSVLDKVTEAVSDTIAKAADVLGIGEDTQGEDVQVEKKPATNGGNGGTIRIQYYRSFISTPKTHKQIVRSVGLTKLNQIVERPDTHAMRGFVKKVPHLLRIVE